MAGGCTCVCGISGIACPTAGPLVLGAFPLLYGVAPLVGQEELPTKGTAGPPTTPDVELLPHAALAAMADTTARARRMRRTGRV
jgi:hypothetical protein